MGTVVIFIFVPILVGILLSLNPLISLSPLSRSRGYGDKVSSYECGFSNLSGQTRAPVTISFYIVAILYLIFDLEIALMIPVIPSLDSMGVTGYWTVLIFIIILTVGFVYELGSGAINWSKIGKNIPLITTIIYVCYILIEVIAGIYWLAFTFYITPIWIFIIIWEFRYRVLSLILLGQPYFALCQPFISNGSKKSLNRVQSIKINWMCHLLHKDTSYLLFLLVRFFFNIPIKIISETIPLLYNIVVISNLMFIVSYILMFKAPGHINLSHHIPNILSTSNPSMSTSNPNSFIPFDSTIQLVEARYTLNRIKDVYSQKSIDSPLNKYVVDYINKNCGKLLIPFAEWDVPHTNIPVTYLDTITLHKDTVIISGTRPTYADQTACVYIFTHPKNKGYYIGSSIDFNDRLYKHYHAVDNLDTKHLFYKAVQKSSTGFENWALGLPFKSINYYYDFFSTIPKHIKFTDLQQQQLHVVFNLFTQFIVRSYEQALISHYGITYNGSKDVVFYSNWQFKDTYNFLKVPTEIINKQGVSLQTFDSLASCIQATGLDYRSTNFKLNHDNFMTVKSGEHAGSLIRVASIGHELLPSVQINTNNTISTLNLEALPLGLTYLIDEKGIVLQVYDSLKDAHIALNGSIIGGMSLNLFKYKNSRAWFKARINGVVVIVSVCRNPYTSNKGNSTAYIIEDMQTGIANTYPNNNTAAQSLVSHLSVSKRASLLSYCDKHNKLFNERYKITKITSQSSIGREILGKSVLRK